MIIGDLVSLFRSVDRLLSLEQKHGAAIEKLNEELSHLKDRVMRLETREDVLIEKARSAAGVAASMTVGDRLFDIASRIGRLEERTSSKRLDPPE